MRVAVLGGGVIGLSVAWRLAESGHQVELYDDARGQGASYAGAGMLAPGGEAWFGEELLMNLGLAALRQWPDFAARLERSGGVDVGLRDEGALLIGTDDADAVTLDRIHELLSQHGVGAERLTRRELRRLEPATAPGLRRGIVVQGDRSVNNRQVVRGLTAAAAKAGATLHRRRADVVTDGVRPRGADTVVPADVVVVAAGAELSGVGGLRPEIATAVRPVKGQILRLRDGADLVTHTIRGLVRGDPVYIVPRADGEVVVGATSEEQGHDVRVTADGVYELLRRAIALVPGLRECELAEAIARSRPGTPDNRPLIGPVADGVVVAAGHYRAGFLLAPLTAEAVLAYVEHREPPEEIASCAPDRFGFAHSSVTAGPSADADLRKNGLAARKESRR